MVSFTPAKIKKLRKDRGMTQKQLGIEVGAAQTTVSSWERGENMPSDEHIEALLNVFDIVTASQVKESSPTPKKPRKKAAKKAATKDVTEQEIEKIRAAKEVLREQLKQNTKREWTEPRKEEPEPWLWVGYTFIFALFIYMVLIITGQV